MDVAMKLPTLEEAERLLREAGERNPGPWTEHSRQVADAARRIAHRMPGMTADSAQIMGLLHDIGRREGVTGMRHVLDGYRYLSGLGYEDAARICLTHSFQNCDHREIFGEWDCSSEEIAFIQGYLNKVELNDYDRLLQLCDSIAMATGCVLMEKRMMDVALRYGVNEFSVRKWRSIIELRTYFEACLGCSIYELLPGVVENTFGFDRARPES